MKVNTIYNVDFLEIIDDIPNGIFDLLILDFPYNMKKDFPNDNMDSDSFKKLLLKWVECIIPKLKDTGSLYCFMGYEFVDHLKLLLSKYMIFRREIIWNYNQSGNPHKTLNYLSEFDKILFFVKSNNYIFNVLRKKPSLKTISHWKDKVNENGVPMWKYISPSNRSKFKSEKEYYEKIKYDIYKGKPYGNVINVSKVNVWSKEYNIHPTQKPEKLIEIFIKVSSNEGDLVGDFFSGSGTTLAVAKKLNRNYFGTEMKKDYYNIIQNRLNNTIKNNTNRLF